MPQDDFSGIKEDAGAIVVNKKTRQVALIKMHHNVWGFPKGGIRKGEDTVEAAKREVYEETGIKKVDVIKEFPVYKRANSYRPDQMISIKMYLFETDQEDLGQVEYDVAEVKWCPIDEVAITLTLQEDIDFFLSVKKDVK